MWTKPASTPHISDAGRFLAVVFFMKCHPEPSLAAKDPGDFLDSNTFKSLSGEEFSVKYLDAACERSAAVGPSPKNGAQDDTS